jgi:trehalose 6-phosphate phosphatase
VDVVEQFEHIARRLGASPAVLLLDVDGTLAPIAPRPEDAEVPEETRRAVARLVGAPGTHVALVSGRAADDARRMVGVAGVWVIGNHGAETVAPDGAVHVDPRVAAAAPALAAAADELSDVTAHVRGVFVEDKRWSLSVHYRLSPPEWVPAVAAAVEDAALRHGLRLRPGKAVRLGADASAGSALFVGDDVTDEDAFRALRAGLPGAVTVRVLDPDASTPPETAAEFVVAGTGGVRLLLERLADLRESPGPARGG